MLRRPRTALALTATLASAAVFVACHDDAVSPRATPNTSATASAAAPAPDVATGEVVPGQYVVLFRRERVAMSPYTAEQLSARKLGGRPAALRRTFTHVVQGFAARLTDSAVTALRADPDVALVAPDPVVHATAGQVETGSPWGLDRIDQMWLTLDGQYHYTATGAGTSVYIVDTGINLSHVEFGGRAVTGIDYVTAGGTATDCNGHGTHVAGIVGGATYGVAKGARLVAVRVLDCSGSGDGSTVIAGLDWVAQQKLANPGTPMVVNMSLGGGAAPVIDSAVARTVAAGVTVVVAAGNSAADACATSPARAPDAITVAATDASDNFASFSNYGTCVDLAAPGVSILSAYAGSTTASAYLSGTSMASPHVAGAAALYLSTNPAATPAQVTGALTSNAVGGPIQGLPANTTSRLLDVEFLAGKTAVPGVASTIRSAAWPQCVDVPSGARTNGTTLQSWSCYGGSNQQFVVPAPGTTGPIHSASGLCLDALSGGSQNGEVVGLWACNGWVHQQWTVTTNGQIRDAATGLCLDLDSGGRGANASRMQLWTCYGSSNQTWVTASQ